MRTCRDIFASTVCAFLSLFCVNALAQQQNKSPVNDTFQSVFTKAHEACTVLWSDHAFDQLRTRIPLGDDKPTFSMLTNSNKIQAEDKPLADLAIKTLEQCRNNYAPVYAMLPDQVAKMIHGVERRQDDLIAQLYTGKISYGDFNVGLNELNGKLAEALSGVAVEPKAEPKAVAAASSQVSKATESQLASGEPTAVFRDKRLALVIGNSDYAFLPKLTNPASDAKSVADVLRVMGYKTQLVLDASDENIRNAVRKFASESATADVAIVYYAGHGAQLNGSNYLLPTNIEIPRTPADIQFTGLRVDDLVNSIASNTKIIFLDACRDNPVLFMNIVSGRGSTPLGLAPASASNLNEAKQGGGVFIAYATDAGAVADDGKGAHSPFTEALLRYMQEPVSIDDMFSLVTREVRLVTKNTQRPYKYASLENIICLAPGCLRAASAAPHDIVEQARQSEEDELQVALRSKNLAALETYFQKYPNSPKRAELIESIADMKRSEFREWTQYELGESKYPQYIKFSSIRRIGPDKVVAEIRWTPSPSMRKVELLSKYPSASSVDDVNVYNCREKNVVTAEETLLDKSAAPLWHYKWADPRYMSFQFALAPQPGTTGSTVLKILCDDVMSVPTVSKAELAGMDFESLSSTSAGDGEMFYKVIDGKARSAIQKVVLLIFKFNESRALPHDAEHILPNYRIEIDRTLVDCQTKKMGTFKFEYYDSDAGLVSLVTANPTEKQLDFNAAKLNSPLALLYKIVCGQGVVQR